MCVYACVCLCVCVSRIAKTLVNCKHTNELRFFDATADALDKRNKS